ncbi:MAG TPA: hypothetical protein VF234_07170, partial [Limnochordia bacterium]
GAGAAAAPTLSAGDLTVKAADNSEIEAVAAQAGAGESAAVGGALAFSFIGNATRASIGQPTGDETPDANGLDVTVTGATTLEATNAATIWTGAATLAGSGTAGVNFSLMSANVANETEALIASSTGNDITSGTLRVTAEDVSTIRSLSGQVAAGGEAAVGGAAAQGYIGNMVRAALDGVDVTATGPVQSGEAPVAVEAVNDAIIETAAVSGGGAGTAAVNGSVTGNVIGNETIAAVNGQGGHRIDAAAVSVSAADQSEIDSLAGNLSGSGVASVGGSIAHNQIGNTVRAMISETDIEAAVATGVTASNASAINTLAVSGGAAGTATVMGSGSSAHIDNTTEAAIIGSAADKATNDTIIRAEDISQIRSASGSAAFSGTGFGGGAAASINHIANTTKAYLSGRLGADSSYELGNLLVESRSEGSIDSAAVSAAAVTGGGVGASGSLAANFIESNTLAYVDGGAQVHAQDNVGVVAQSDDVIRNLAGGASYGDSAGIGGSLSVNHLGGSTKAYIAGSDTEVSALARGGALTVDGGALSGDVDLAAGLDPQAFVFNESALKGLRTTRQVQGVAVNASATHNINNVAVSGGASIYGVGGAGTVNTNVITGTTAAYVDGAAINAWTPPGEQPGAGQSLDVSASDHAYAFSLAGAVAAGTLTGLGAAGDNNVFVRNTEAYVRDSGRIGARKAVGIAALSSQGAVSVVLNGVAGLGGLGAAASVGVFAGRTEAYLENGVVGTTDLSVTAGQTSRFLIGAGSAAVAGGGDAAAFAVAVSAHSTRAAVESSQVRATGAVSVHSEQETEFIHAVVSGGIGGASVAGSAVVSVATDTTEAYVVGSAVGGSSAGQRAGSLSVTADDSLRIQNDAGVGSAGASAGVGATASITYAGNTTAAFVAASQIAVDGEMEVAATARRDLQTLAATASLAGVVGIGGVAGAILVGSPLPSEASSILSDLDSGGDGTLTRLNALSTGDRLNAGREGQIGPQTGQQCDEQGENCAETRLTLSAEDINSVNNPGGDSPGVENGRIDLKAALGGGAPSATTAQIMGGSIIDAGSVTVRAAEEETLDLNVGGVNGALLGAVGGVAGVAIARHTVRAEILGGSAVTARAGDIVVDAG